MAIEKLHVKLTFTDEVLGMSPSDPEVHRKYIASKAPDAKSLAEEVAASGVDDVARDGMTVFPRDAYGNPIFFDYQVKGFFKDACGALARAKGTLSSQVTAYKKIIDGLVFVDERQIPIELPDNGEMGVCERPLRASTAQGERVALASSETVPAGSTIEFTVSYMPMRAGRTTGKVVDLHDLIVEWLDYGALRGMAQWRNSGKGRFTYEVL